ncbi:MAG TPA: electron-transfer flavoprotein:ubiquinone oxidoreductase [Gemmatimonadales bacterium]|jgi:electron-transferring-flavoprotein dehydrogenase|nr:electron-transfer flavoprotein:ubiquinone oxidoreductase [Gemmatimonadales bacterium]
MATFTPIRQQPPLPLDRLIRADPPGPEAIELDVLFVGAGPAGLAGAIELATLARRDGRELNIGVLEKAGALGEHSLSGAVVNPRAFRELFPELADSEFPFRRAVEREQVCFLTRRHALRIPTPPTMRNHGNYVASLSEMVRWLGARAEALGVNLLAGFPAEALLTEGTRVRGVRTTPSGLDRNGSPREGYQEPTELTAAVTVLAEGTRGALAQAWRSWQGVESPNPQIFALGVKEVWRVGRPLDTVVHTLGWPVPLDAFGGTFLYPMGQDQVALGMVAGLDAPGANFDVHELLQRLKLHPFFRSRLEGGELLEWGAKTIPEGGYWSLPERLSGDGILLTGDCAGLVDVASLKGIHYAMQSGIFAARTAFQALQRADTSAAMLSGYDRLVRESYLVQDLKRTRNMRLVFKHGFALAALENGLLTLTRGAFPGWRIPLREDAAMARRTEPPPAEPLVPDGRLTVSKLDAVFKSGNATRDTIPSHLLVPAEVEPELAEFYSHVCPAGVYERTATGLRVNPPNCVDCKATDVLGPRWLPREGGSGPKYRLM